ncbi:4-phosphoerythronate dehydrogenase PdxB [Pseudomonas oryzihabitans]|uniref:4-phosphoerythronate dehydrogenase PdxB n=1 Tax=Pseudomonas oryzihabitans TaxID=47885 RepID=UPI001DDD1BE2|nr:4-phosphoerythronate dehydrogenase PdxB [Pseudomonas oryzihabitans]HJE66974.1 4-phosphoerythronate dehydrogenase PdxB [Pseudomonas oryzihabitans]
MHILADENIPLLDAFFRPHATLERLPGRAFDRAAVGRADALLVRSITRVDAALLAGSRVGFVGTCTIGTDHLDLGYLDQAGIRWSNAPGCNARGVVDWVLGALLALADGAGAELAQRTYGIVGAGQVGGRLAEVLRGLGWTVLVCDPPRQAAEGGDFHSLDELLERCDVLCLHTPLIRDGEQRTLHLFDAARLASLRPGTWLLNACRGEVVDNAALRTHLASGAELRVALDVWEGEPGIDPELARLCHLVTPHIAGHSLEGKWRGTAQIYEAFCAWSGETPRLNLGDLLPPQQLERLVFSGDTPEATVFRRVCRAVYDPRDDDAALRATLGLPAVARAQAFDALRKGYPMRREIPGLVLDGAGVARLARALGCSWRHGDGSESGGVA